jgi:hypothetical protein
MLDDESSLRDRQPSAFLTTPDAGRSDRDEAIRPWAADSRLLSRPVQLNVEPKGNGAMLTSPLPHRVQTVGVRHVRGATVLKCRLNEPAVREKGKCVPGARVRSHPVNLSPAGLKVLQSGVKCMWPRLQQSGGQHEPSYPAIKLASVIGRLIVALSPWRRARFSPV